MDFGNKLVFVQLTVRQNLIAMWLPSHLFMRLNLKVIQKGFLLSKWWLANPLKIQRLLNLGKSVELTVRQILVSIFLPYVPTHFPFDF